jgi:penicillin-binding protein 2
LISRFVYLQIIKGNYYSAAENNRQRIIPIPAERGLIFDRNGVQLTKNIPNFSLAVVPQDLPRKTEEKQKVVDQLASLTGKTQEEISAILDEYGSYSYESVVIQENLDYDTALNIIIKTGELPG